MRNQPENINRHTVAFQLNEALETVGSTVRDACNGLYLEDALGAELAVMLGHILGHLCQAWHRRQMGPDDVVKESLEEFNLNATSVPNWGGHFQLVETATSHPAIDFFLSRQKIDVDTMCVYLLAAEVALQALIEKIDSGQFDSCDISLLGNEFELVLCNLCLAWHLRYLSGDEVSSLDPTIIDELRSWLPSWQWNLRLNDEAPPIL